MAPETADTDLVVPAEPGLRDALFLKLLREASKERQQIADVISTLIETTEKLEGSVATLREEVRALSAGASSEKPKSDLGAAMRAVADGLNRNTDVIEVLVRRMGPAA